MPKSRPISAPLRESLLECYRTTTCLVCPELRRQLILVGGAASIAHGSELYTEDVDVVAPEGVIQDICKGVMDGALNYSLETDGKIAFDTSQDIRIRIDLLRIGDVIERIHAIEPFFEGSVASKLDLLRLRAETVVDRGKDGDVNDFRWLLSRVANAGQVITGLDSAEIKNICGAGRSSLAVLDRLVLYAMLEDDQGEAFGLLDF